MSLIQLSDPSQRLWLSGLLFLWAAFLFGGFVFGAASPSNRRKSLTRRGEGGEGRQGGPSWSPAESLGAAHAGTNRRMPTWTRMASSLTLVIASWSWYLFTRESQVSLFSLLIAIGMTLGCLGDFLLAKLIPFPEPTLGGIAAFGLGHVAYISAILSFANQQAFTAPATLLGAWFVWLLIGLIGWYVIVLRGNKLTVLRIAALPYALLLASTAGFATGLALQSPPFIPLAIGGALFLTSDLILAAELFNNLKFPLIGDVVWLTYGPAQMLIVFAVNDALLALGVK